jgi:hypothetical protein
MQSVYDNAIRPAIEKAGYDPYRVDMEPHGDPIDVRIMAKIKDSRFVVADMTGQRHNVYFEAGYAMGLGLPVIRSVRKSDADDIKFDLQHYQRIPWETKEQLRDDLFNYIVVFIGKGPKYKDNKD